MAKPRKKHHHRPSGLAPQPAPRPAERSAQELFDAADYAGVIALLRGKIGAQSPDEELRLLAYALLLENERVPSERAAEALALLEQLRDKNAKDWRRSGWCCLALERWEEAAGHFERSNAIEETPSAYHLLAWSRHQLRRQAGRSAAGEAGPAIFAALQKATAMAGCPPDAFLLLDDYHIYGPEEERDSLEALARGQQAYPDHPALRYRLALRCANARPADRDRALALLDPLLAPSAPPPAALWLAFECHWQRRDRERCFALLDQIAAAGFPVEGGAELLAFVRGMAFFRFGEGRAALEALEPFCARPPATDEILEEYNNISAPVNRYLLALAACGAVHAALGEYEQAERCAAQFGDFFNQNAFLMVHGTELESDHLFGAWFCYEESLDGSLGGHIDWNTLDCQEDYRQAARLLRAELGDFLSRRRDVGGWLRYCDLMLSSLPVENEPSLDSQLEELSALLPAPATSRRLSYRYFSQDNLAAGLEHHLRYCLWFAESYQEKRKGDRTIRLLVDLDGPGGQQGDSRSTVKNPAQARQVHQFLFSALQRNRHRRNADVVFIRLYSRFWRDVLLRYRMHEEMRLVAEALLDLQPADQDLLFDHAYGLAAVGQADTSMAVYRRLLQLYPKNHSALHNLAVGLQHAGQLDEALALARQAAELRPTDALTAQVLGEIASAIQERDQPRPARRKSANRPPSQPRPDNPPPAVVPSQRALKETFDSPNERLFYYALLSLFPNCLVFPNMATSAIFDYDAMQALLDRRAFDYFLKSRVDFCVVSPVSYLPLCAFEVDSRFHDLAEIAEKDALKDAIFNAGGLPLLRFRFSKESVLEELKRAIRDALRDAGVDFTAF